MIVPRPSRDCRGPSRKCPGRSWGGPRTGTVPVKSRDGRGTAPRCSRYGPRTARAVRDRLGVVPGRSRDRPGSILRQSMDEPRAAPRRYRNCPRRARYRPDMISDRPWTGPARSGRSPVHPKVCSEAFRGRPVDIHGIFPELCWHIPGNGLGLLRDGPGTTPGPPYDCLGTLP